MGLATLIMDSTSLVPPTGAAAVSTVITDTAADLWPVLAVGVGVTVLVKIIRRFV